jgi:Malectin domain
VKKTVVKKTVRLLSVVVLIQGLLVAAAATPSVAMGTTHDPGASHNVIVSPTPAAFTPDVLDGAVKAFTRIGNTIFAGGTFTQVKDAGGPTLSRVDLFAFNASTGAITSFAPVLDGEVDALTTDGTSLFVGGLFKTVNGAASSRIAKLDPVTGLAVPGFNVKVTSGTSVLTMAVSNRTLYIGGAFSIINGQTRGRLAALDPNTGAVDPSLNISFDGKHNAGQTRVLKLSISPSGSELVAIGNFVTVNGFDRNQIAMIDLTTTPKSVATWETDRYKAACSSRFDTYMHDVDFSPDGSYFVVADTGAFFGGANAGVLCDATTRWESNARGPAQQPTWADYTGGDTTWSVAATGAAIYVGGHMRWENNAFAGDALGPGGTPRKGIAALDPVNGVPFSWNPTKDRGEGVYAFLVTNEGLWVGSDTANFANEYHNRIAFVPVAGGETVPPANQVALPNELYTLPYNGCQGPDTSVLYRVDAAGPAIPSLDCGPDWAVDTSATPSPYHNVGSNAASWSPIAGVDGTVPASTPISLFSTERWDPSTSAEMSWSFPVPSGTAVNVRLYFANSCTCTQQAGQRTFDVTIDNTTVLSNFDIVQAAGNLTGTMRQFSVTSDGSVDIAFGHRVENPLINGIEIVTAGGGGSPGTVERLDHRSFTGSTLGSISSLATPGVDWTQARGAFLTNGKLYTGWSNGNFYSRTFDGSSVGPANQINLNGLTNSYFPVASITGMFFVNGRIYYTVIGDQRLYYRYFTPESDVVGGVTFTASGAGDGLDWSTVQGLTLASGRIYFSGSDGNLYGINFNAATGVPVPGTQNLISGPSTGDGTNWRGHGMFLFPQIADTFAPSKPGTPTGASHSVGTVDLSWAASTDSGSSTLTYDVYRNDGSGDVLAGSLSSASTTTVSFTDSGPTPGDTYTYTVDATDGALNTSARSDPSASITVQAPDVTPPTAPGKPAGAANGKTKIDLSWQASTDDTSTTLTYRVYRDGNSTPVGTVTSNSTATVTFTDSGLGAGTSHTYTVDALDAANNPSALSPVSDPITTLGVIFADSFDSADFSAWTTVTRLSIDPTTGGVAPPSALANPTAQSAWAALDLVSTYPSACLSVSMQINSLPVTTIDLLRLRTAANGPIARVMLTSTGKLLLNSDVSGLQKATGVALPAGWNNLELCGTVGSAGTWDLYLNGGKIVDSWVADTGIVPIGRIQIGYNQAATYSLNFDDVVLDQVPG